LSAYAPTPNVEDEGSLCLATCLKPVWQGWQGWSFKQLGCCWHDVSVHCYMKAP